MWWQKSGEPAPPENQLPPPRKKGKESRASVKKKMGNGGLNSTESHVRIGREKKKRRPGVAHKKKKEKTWSDLELKEGERNSQVQR